MREGEEKAKYWKRRNKHKLNIRHNEPTSWLEIKNISYEIREALEKNLFKVERVIKNKVIRYFLVTIDNQVFECSEMVYIYYVMKDNRLVWKTARSKKRISKSLSILLNRKEITQQDKVFDWGCGYGHEVMQLRKKGIKAEGYDLYLRKEINPVHYIEKYNTVLLLGVIDYLPYKQNIIELLSKIHSFLPSDGKLYVSVRTIKSLEGQAQSKQWQKFNDGYVTSYFTFNRLVSLNQLRDYLREAGFKAYFINQNPLIVKGVKTL